MVEVTGRVFKVGRATNVFSTDLRVVRSGITMPTSDDWH